MEKISHFHQYGYNADRACGINGFNRGNNKNFTFEDAKNISRYYLQK